jgi:hypothetical protein
MIESFCIFLGTGIPLEGIVASSLWCFVFLFNEFYCSLAIHFSSYSGFSVCITSRLIAYFGDMSITRKRQCTIALSHKHVCYMFSPFLPPIRLLLCSLGLGMSLLNTCNQMLKSHRIEVHSAFRCHPIGFIT